MKTGKSIFGAVEIVRKEIQENHLKNRSDGPRNVMNTFLNAEADTIWRRPG